MTTTMLRGRDGNFQDDINIVECSYWEWDIFFSPILDSSLCLSMSFSEHYVRIPTTFTRRMSSQCHTQRVSICTHSICLYIWIWSNPLCSLNTFRSFIFIAHSDVWDQLDTERKKMLISSRRLLTYISISYIDVWLFFPLLSLDT